MLAAVALSILADVIGATGLGNIQRNQHIVDMLFANHIFCNRVRALD